MTKVILPILKKQIATGSYTSAQIVNIVSVAGMTSAGGLAASAYEGSKHAAEAFTNALRLEMKMFGIRVVALNPSFFDTPLTQNVKERFSFQLSQKLSTDTQNEYGIGKWAVGCWKEYYYSLLSGADIDASERLY
jgi:NAD(P)-dependent dehydrogenase (short-subunit alcohol dehydrogenase family)